MGIAGGEHSTLKDSMCKGPEAGMSLLCPRNRKASEAEEEGDGVGELGNTGPDKVESGSLNA